MSVKLGGLVFDFSANTAEYDKAMAKATAAEEKLANLEIQHAKEREREATAMAQIEAQLERDREKSNALYEARNASKGAQRKALNKQMEAIAFKLEQTEQKLYSLQRTAKINETARLGALKKINDEISETKSNLDKVKSAGQRIGKVFSGLGGTIASAITVGAFKRIIDDLDGLAKRARDVGMTASQLQELSHQAKLAGASTSQLDVNIKTFNRNISLAAMGTGEAKTALKEMGISLTTANGAMKSQSQLLRETAKHFAENAGNATNAGKAARIFGENSAEILRVFESGGDVIDKVFNADAIDKAADAAERFNEKLENVRNKSFKLGASVISGWSDISDYLTNDIFNGLGDAEYKRAEKRANEEAQRIRNQIAANEQARKKAENEFNSELEKQSDILRGEISPLEKLAKIQQNIADINAQTFEDGDYFTALKLAKELTAQYKEQASIQKQLNSTQNAKDQSREAFELETKIQILRAQGKDEEAKRLEFAKNRNALMDKYGYSIQQATAAQKTLDALKDKESGGKGSVKYSDEAKKRAEAILKRGEGGTVGKQTLKEAQAIVNGESLDGGFKTSMFERLTKGTPTPKDRIKSVNVDAKAAGRQLNEDAKGIEQKNADTLDAINNALGTLNSTISDIKNTVNGISTNMPEN